MVDFEKINTYKRYLNSLEKRLDDYFRNQKEYICCKKGCSYCCEEGAYPFSKTEMEYMLMGMLKLEQDKQLEIMERISKLKEKYEICNNKKNFMYRCPFLDNGRNCMIYDFRGIICRTFGTLHITPEGKAKIPFCYKYGLNYSKVYNEKERRIDFEKAEELGYKNPPMGYEITLATLTDKKIFKDEEFDFGEIKPLIEWL